MLRGEIWWADLPEPAGSMPGYPRPVLVVQADRFNRTGIRTVLVLIMTSTTRLAAAPGNVLLPKNDTGLPKDSVANITQVYTVDRELLTERVGMLPSSLMRDVDNGLRPVLGL
jgi:mRNA interferase MazF